VVTRAVLSGHPRGSRARSVPTCCRTRNGTTVSNWSGSARRGGWPLDGARV